MRSMVEGGIIRPLRLTSLATSPARRGSNRSIGPGMPIFFAKPGGSRGGLFREWRLLTLRQTDLEDVERVPDQGVVADDRDDLDDAFFAERLDRLAEAR